MTEANNQSSTTDEPKRPPAQVIVMIQTTEDGKLEINLQADASVFVPTAHGDRPDKTIPAVHFAHWLNVNKQHLAALWEAQYAQYMNLVRLTAKEKVTPRDIGLVDPHGTRLGTGTTQ